MLKNCFKIFKSKSSIQPLEGFRLETVHETAQKQFKKRRPERVVHEFSVRRKNSLPIFVCLAACAAGSPSRIHIGPSSFDHVRQPVRGLRSDLVVRLGFWTKMLLVNEKFSLRTTRGRYLHRSALRLAQIRVLIQNQKSNN